MPPTLVRRVWCGSEGRALRSPACGLRIGPMLRSSKSTLSIVLSKRSPALAAATQHLPQLHDASRFSRHAFAVLDSFSTLDR